MYRTIARTLGTLVVSGVALSAHAQTFSVGANNGTAQGSWTVNVVKLGEDGARTWRVTATADGTNAPNANVYQIGLQLKTLAIVNVATLSAANYGTTAAWSISGGNVLFNTGGAASNPLQLQKVGSNTFSADITAAAGTAKNLQVTFTGFNGGVWKTTKMLTPEKSGSTLFLSALLPVGLMIRRRYSG